MLSTYGQEGEIQLLHDQELNLDYFLFKQVTPAGTISEVSINYQLAGNYSLQPTSSYRLIVDKQAGFIGANDLEKRLHFQQYAHNKKLFPTGWLNDGQTEVFRTNLDKDRIFGAVWGK
jgi:hypothetical protein